MEGSSTNQIPRGHRGYRRHMGGARAQGSTWGRVQGDKRGTGAQEWVLLEGALLLVTIFYTSVG